MDNYRDLVSAALALFCAGVMLVVGHLFIEWRARNGDPGLGMEAPKSEDLPSPSISNGSPSNKEMMELQPNFGRSGPRSPGRHRAPTDYG